jgi:hypothetical protein
MNSGNEPVFGLHFVAAVVLRKSHLEAAVAGTGGMLERGLAIPQLICADDEVFVGVEGLTRSNKVIELVMVKSPSMHYQHGVVLGCIELAVRDVGHLKMVDHCPAFELEIAKLGNLMRRLVGPMGEGWSLYGYQ